MSQNFFSLAWPLAVSIILLAGLVVTLAAVATLVAAIAKTRQIVKGQTSQASDEEGSGERAYYPYKRSSGRSGSQGSDKPGVVDTATTDDIHFTPVL